MRTFILSAVLSFLPTLALAQDTRFEVEFLAHAVVTDSPGHAWVCLYRAPNIGPPARSCVGFFVKDPTREFFALLSAKDRPSIVKTSPQDDGRVATVAYRGATTEQGYAAVQRVVQQWERKGYNVKWSNCADFVEAVALAAGFEAPNHPGIKYPTEYLRKLGKANPSKLVEVKPGA